MWLAAAAQDCKIPAIDPKVGIAVGDANELASKQGFHEESSAGELGNVLPVLGREMAAQLANELQRDPKEQELEAETDA